MTYKTYTVQTAFGCSGVGEYGPMATPLVDTITFPDGSADHFSYEATPGVPGNVTGRLAGVELPQGGWINYSYSGGNNGIICADGSTAGLTRTINSDSGSAASTWTYSRTTGTGTSHTEVVDGLNNHLAYDFVEPTGTFTPATYYETNRSVYQGAESGTPVLARHTCYDGATSPCTTATFALPISQIDTDETIDGIETHGATAKYNTYGMETETDIYDFGGPTSRGALLRTEQWTYGTTIPSLPTADVVSSGTKILYGYDAFTVTASSGVPQHMAVSGPRGNLTAEDVFYNSSKYYLYNWTYEDTGSPLTSTSPNGATTLSYDSTFVYTTGDVLPTPSSGVSLQNAASYDTANTGLPLSTTGPNSQTTHYSYSDPLLRPTELDSPDGGKTTLSYSPTQLSQHIYQSSSVYSDTETQYDGYGRQSRAAVFNGQSGNDWYQSDTCYDANGNVAFLSYPYQGTGFDSSKVCSGSGDTYTYDVLGRIKTVSHGDGTSGSYTYVGRATQYSDENGATRVAQIDGLGRPTIVCEISSNSSMPGSGSPTSCGTDISGTGFTTTYSYTSATGTTTITQGAQTRIFQTDSLGRPISVTEPESGTTTYSYAYNSTGLVVTRQRPQANQTNPSVLTTTTTQYDSLGRVVSISYSDGTPLKAFAYDASANWGITQTNLKGHLSFAAVNGAGTVYSYDPTGRVTILDECLPSGCGNGAYDKQLYYTYDLAGNLTSSTDGGGVTTTYTVSPADEVLSMVSSLSNATNPANVLSNVQNGPDGPVSWSVGNGLSGVYIYDTMGRVAGGWLCNGSTSAYCTGGTQIYGFTSGWKGVRETGECDTVLNQCIGYGYDEFNRLNSRTVTAGTVQNYTYVYDRYGNLWQQNALQGGYSSSLSFNTASNQVTNSGFQYDAAGNMSNDSFHTYTYDAEGNLTQVDGGATAQYVYNALNQRVRTVVGSTAREFVFNLNGQRVSIWDGTSHNELQGQYYWGGKPLAYHSGGAIHFQQQDWLGTERLRTTYNGGVEGRFTSLSFGDGQATSGSDTDAYHFAGLDHDSETDTDHAQFRQYSNAQGRWMSPDPYTGSYDLSNPQSFNRYMYVLNNPLAYVDQMGLFCIMSEGVNPDGTYTLTSDCYYSGGGGIGGIDYGAPGGPIAYGGPGGHGGGGGGTGTGTGTSTNSNTTNNRFFHSVVCDAFSGLVNAAGPQNLNSTIGVGVGGSAGIGFILGVAASAGVQVVADSSGNLGVAFNFGGNPGYGVFGAGATGGVQGSYSTDSSIYGLRGFSVGAGVSAFNGELDGSVGSGGVITGTVTAGAGVGTKGAALSLNYTFVPSALSTNCSQ